MRNKKAFTLIELLVVVAIIALLIAILLPSMHRAIDVANRAVCAANLHQIHIGAVTYAADNIGVLFICKGRQVQIGFDPLRGHSGRPEDLTVDWIGALASVGLAGKEKVDVGGGNMRNLPSDVWNCPSRDFQSFWNEQYDAIAVGYQYMGGIETWVNPFVGSMPSRSPVTIAASRPNWVLAADATAKIDGAWGGGSAGYVDMPPHKDGNNPWPEGHNQVDMGGSVQWIDGDDLIYIHSWNAGLNRVFFMHQDDLGGWIPPAGAYLEAFK